MNEDKTIAIQANATIPAANNLDTTQRLASTTSRTSTQVKQGASAADNVIPANNKTFFIKGKTYNVVKNLSETSGEAQIFLVENEGNNFVLKLYYPNFKPKEELLKVIWNMQFELIVNIYDYGTIIVSGANRAYELMEYLEGGTIKDINIKGDETRFCRIALAAAGALAYCHNNLIIHKDIKPGNFFFRDKEQECLVLGDFGISSLYDEEAGLQKTTQARTPVYAAPEMYTDVIDGEVEITPKVDYYSLGITLLYLWMGRNPFSNNERSMMRMKSEGKLPHLDKLPVYINKLIRGLTCVNPEHRWGYDEVERWYKGEDVEIDESSAFLRYKTFMVDPDKNIAAHSAVELAPLLYDNKELGIRYLYSRRITKWLEECGNPKLAALLEDIIERQFPTDQQHGLLAAIYTMCPDFPYHDIKGNACSSIREITLSLISNIDDYGMLLRNKDSELYIYLKTHCETDVEKLKRNFSTDSPRIAVWKLIYTIDKDMPFLADKPSATIEDIANSFGNSKCTVDEWESITDGRLLAWIMCHCDNFVYETAKSCLERFHNEPGLAHILFYHLIPGIGYDLCKADTPYKVGEILEKKLKESQNLNDKYFENTLTDFLSVNGRFAVYANIQGWKDITDEYAALGEELENKGQRHGNYDNITAMYKLCVILLRKTEYKFKDRNVENIDELCNIGKSELRHELENGHLHQWMAVHFHESPTGSIRSAQSFIEKLAEYLNKIGELNPDDAVFKRFVKAKELTGNKKNNVERMLRNVANINKNFQRMLYILTAITCMMALFYGIPENLKDHIGVFIGMPIAIGSLFVGVTSSYSKGNGALITILAGAIGLASAFIPVTIINWVIANMPGMTNVAVAAIIAIYAGTAIMLGQKERNVKLKSLQDIVNEDENNADGHQLQDYLFYAFKTNTRKFKGGKFGVYDDTSNELKQIKNDIVFHYAAWCLLLLMIVLSFALFHPELSGNTIPNINNLSGQLKHLAN